jgi:hypothetical protein
MRLWRTVIVMIAGLMPALCPAAEPLPRSVLILDQSGPGLPWYMAATSALRSALNRNSAAPISVYIENLDLNRFNGPRYEQTLKNHFQEKYGAKSFGAIVAIGPVALEFVLRSRSEMEIWSGVPVIFAAVDETTAAKMNLPPDVTGGTIHLTPGAMLSDYI